MDPIVESHWLYRWRETDIPADTSVDPSLRQLRESRVRAGLLYQCQSDVTQLHLRQQAARIAETLSAGKGEIHFRLPERVLWPAKKDGEVYSVEVPADFRDQKVSGFLRRLPVRDVRSAFRSRLAHLENSGYSGVKVCADLVRFAVARHIVHELIPGEFFANLPAAMLDGGPASVPIREGEGFRPDIATEDPQEANFLQDAEAAMAVLRRGMNTLHQAVSIAPYMYADEEYQWKRDLFLGRLLSLGHSVANGHVRDIVRTIRRRAGANDLNRGLWLSVPYFDDRTLELKMHEFEVIPPGRTMFVPAFVALAAVREQEKIGLQNSLSPSTRVHLLAELKSLEQAFDNRPQ